MLFLPYGVEVKHLGHALSHARIQDVVIGHSELAFVRKVDIFARYLQLSMVQKNTAQASSFTVNVSNLSPLVQVACFFPAELKKHASFVM